MDIGLRTLLYSKFGDILGISTQSSFEETNINKGVILIPKETALREVSEKRGKNFLEFINLWRVGTEYSWSRNNTYVSRRGIDLPVIVGNRSSYTTVKAVPMDLNYEICFWSKDLDKINLCTERYMFWIHNNPKLNITYSDLYPLAFDIHFSPVNDESTIARKYTEGLIYVASASIKVDGWTFNSETFNSGIISKIRVTTYDKDEVENYYEICVEDEDQNVELAAALKMLRQNLYGIFSINASLNTIKILGEFASDFLEGKKIFIENSTDNNGVYTIISSTQTDGFTYVELDESLTSDTNDGNLYFVE